MTVTVTVSGGSIHAAIAAFLNTPQGQAPPFNINFARPQFSVALNNGVKAFVANKFSNVLQGPPPAGRLKAFCWVNWDNNGTPQTAFMQWSYLVNAPWDPQAAISVSLVQGSLIKNQGEEAD